MSCGLEFLKTSDMNPINGLFGIPKVMWYQDMSKTILRINERFLMFNHKVDGVVRLVDKDGGQIGSVTTQNTF